MRGGMGESGCRQGGHPVGYCLGSCVHAWRLGDWPVAQEPGHTPEVCLLLWVGASEITPWSPGLGLGLAEHQGALPTQQEPWREPRQVGVGSRADDGAIALWIAF